MLDDYENEQPIAVSILKNSVKDDKTVHAYCLRQMFIIKKMILFLLLLNHCYVQTNFLRLIIVKIVIYVK